MTPKPTAVRVYKGAAIVKKSRETTRVLMKEGIIVPAPAESRSGTRKR